MDDNRHIRKITTAFYHDRNSHANSLVTDADFRFHSSFTKHTIRKHFFPGIPREGIPLETDKEGEIHPQNPTNQYVSQFVDRFDDCLACDSTQYLFKFCPRKEDKTLRNVFW